MHLRSITLALTAAVAACPTEPPTPPVPVVPDRAPLAVSFTPCGFLAGESDERADCAIVDAPLTRDGEGNAVGDATLSLFVKRVQATLPAERRMFLLMGGPGQPGSDGEGIARAYADADLALEVIIADHRGTGSSTILSCPVEEEPASPGGAEIVDAEWSACIAALQAEWGEGLSSFSATEAAHDVIDLAASLDELPTFLLGISYGTYLANRALQLEPDAFTGVVFDSMCPPGECIFNGADVTEDEEAEAIFALCATDADCSERFEDAWAALDALYLEIDGGHCNVAEDAPTTRLILRTMLGVMMSDAGVRRIAPALVHRFIRCNEADQEAIAHLAGLFFGQPGDPPPAGFNGFSFPLSNNIALSEMWRDAPGPDDVIATTETLRVARGVGAQLARVQPLWPTYDEPLKDGIAVTTAPLLILNAEHDTVTPKFYAEEYASHFTGPNQSLVILPGSAHATVAQGLIVSRPGVTCGFLLSLAFMQEPTAALDTSCTALTLPLEFNVGPQFSTSLLGVPDIWGDE